MSSKVMKRATLAAVLGAVLAWPGCLGPAWLALLGSPDIWGTATAVFASNAACALGPCGDGVDLAELLDPFIPGAVGQTVGQSAGP